MDGVPPRPARPGGVWWSLLKKAVFSSSYTGFWKDVSALKAADAAFARASADLACTEACDMLFWPLFCSASSEAAAWVKLLSIACAASHQGAC